MLLQEYVLEGRSPVARMFQVRRFRIGQRGRHVRARQAAPVMQLFEISRQVAAHELLSPSRVPLVLQDRVDPLDGGFIEDRQKPREC